MRFALVSEEHPVTTEEVLRIPTPVGFSLAESRAFLTGFRPVATSGDTAAIDLAFALDGSWEPVGLRIADAGDSIIVEVVANPEQASDSDIRRNVERILSLDHDGSAYTAVGERDPIVGRLQRARPGLRPPLFPSAWEAGVWAILSQRTRRPQALSIKHGLAKAHGTPVTFPNGASVHSFPGLRVPRAGDLRAGNEGVAGSAGDRPLLGRADPGTRRGQSRHLPDARAAHS
jgi:DNA-3-methyladenine glycosylase II